MAVVKVDRMRKKGRRKQPFLNRALICGWPIKTFAAMVALPALPLNGAGKLSLSLPLPNNPGLIGLTFYAQAWIHAQAQSNPP